MKGWALITGSAKRIGRAIALELANHGFDIIIHYNHSAKEAQKLAEEIQDIGQSACLAELDLANTELVKKLIPSLTAELGSIHVLVNNASLFEPYECDPDGSRHMTVNYEAPRFLSKAFRDQLPKGERGVIINILDAASPASKFSAYVRSNNSLADLTLNMAKSFAPHVRVNGVAPTYVLPSARQSEESFRKLAKDNIVTPERVAQAVRKLIETPTITGVIERVENKP